MHYPNDPTVLEASDITAAFIDGTVALPGNRVGIRLVVAVNTLSGKVYSDKHLPTSLFVTNGISPRRLPLLPLPDMPHAAVPDVPATKTPAPIAPTTETSGEKTPAK